jgi:hypothetical protein
MIVNTSGSYKWIDLTLNAAGGYVSNGGMCNKLGNKDGKLYGKTTSYPVAQHPEYFESWKVSDADNLLLGKYRLTKPEKAVPVTKCVLPTGPKPKPKPSPVVTLPPYVPVITTSVAPKPLTSAAPVQSSPAPVQSSSAPVSSVAPSSSPAPAASSAAPSSSGAPAASSVVPSSSAIPAASSAAPSSSPAPVQTTAQETYAVTTVPVATTTQPKPTQVPPPPPEYKTQVENHCKNLFKEECGTVVDREFYVQACIKDALLLGSLVNAEATKIQYMAQCKTKTDYLKEDADDKKAEKAKEIQETAGLGPNKCPKDCSGNGVCGDNGCRCKPSFGGQDCSVDLTKMISYDQETKKYNPTTPTTVYPEVGSMPASDKEVQDLKPKGTTQIVSSAKAIGVSFGFILLSML